MSALVGWRISLWSSHTAALAALETMKQGKIPRTVSGNANAVHAQCTTRCARVSRSLQPLANRFLGEVSVEGLWRRDEPRRWTCEPWAHVSFRWQGCGGLRGKHTMTQASAPSSSPLVVVAAHTLSALEGCILEDTCGNPALALATPLNWNQLDNVYGICAWDREKSGLKLMPDIGACMGGRWLGSGVCIHKRVHVDATCIQVSALGGWCGGLGAAFLWCVHVPQPGGALPRSIKGVHFKNLLATCANVSCSGVSQAVYISRGAFIFLKEGLRCVRGK